MRARLSLIVSCLALSVAAAQAPSRVFVVVFDDQNLSSGGLRRLQTAATALFTNEFHPGDLGGVVVDGDLIGSRLLSDRAELLAAVQRAHPRLATASDLESATQIGGGVEPSARLAEIQSLDVARAALDRKLSIVETLVANLARIDGPKAVLIASESFGGDGGAPRVAALVETARRAGVRFHVFDESGNDRDAAGSLARSTGGQAAHKAIEFAPAIAAIGKGNVSAPMAAVTPAAVPSTSSAVPARVAESPRETPAAPAITNGVVVAAPSVEPGVLRVRPLTEAGLMTLAGGDWSEVGARVGWEAYQRGDLESARTALAPIAARSTAPSWVRYVLGQADYALGHFQDAAVAWERVRARQPQFQPVYFDLADDYVKLNDRRTALQILRAARQRWPKDADIFNALGVTQAGGGDLDGAIKTLREAIAVTPEESITYLNLAKALEMAYMKRRRESQLLQWRMGKSEGDLYQNALAAYRRYLTMNGPYANLAQEGVDRLLAAAPNLRPR